MKILIVGGAGYIGSHVTKAFLKNGDTVAVFDNLSSGLAQNLFPEAEFFNGDIRNPADLAALLKKHSAIPFDGLVHLAALKAAGESMEKPGKYAENNIYGSLNLMQAAVDFKIPRFVFSSTAAVYGSPQNLPIDESNPAQPENFYGFTKLKIEEFLKWYDQIHGLKFAALRYFNAAGYAPDGTLYGLEKNPQNLLPIVMEVANGTRQKVVVFGGDYPTRDGTGVRDYIHVSDLADAHVMAMQKLKEDSKSLTVNLGSETGVSVLEMIKAVEKITGKKIPCEISARRPGDCAELYATSAYASKLLNWKARHSDLDTLVATTWQAYRKNSPNFVNEGIVL